MKPTSMLSRKYRKASNLSRFALGFGPYNPQLLIMTADIRIGTDWIGVIEYWNEDLFYSDIWQ
jgi:hypothetical protein